MLYSILTAICRTRHDSGGILASEASASKGDTSTCCDKMCIQRAMLSTCLHFMKTKYVQAALMSALAQCHSSYKIVCVATILFVCTVYLKPLHRAALQAVCPLLLPHRCSGFPDCHACSAAEQRQHPVLAAGTCPASVFVKLYAGAHIQCLRQNIVLQLYMMSFK